MWYYFKVLSPPLPLPIPNLLPVLKLLPPLLVYSLLQLPGLHLAQLRAVGLPVLMDLLRCNLHTYEHTHVLALFPGFIRALVFVAFLIGLSTSARVKPRSEAMHV